MGLSEDPIPSGVYCYSFLSPMDSQGRMRVNGMCPYWESRGKEKAYCRFLDVEDEIILWDQIKICTVRDQLDDE